MMEIFTDDYFDLPHIDHGFFTRKGGVSEGIYNSLNCGPGSGDSIYNVIKNRGKVCDVLGADILVTGHQVHSTDVAVVTKDWNPDQDIQCDALVTNQPGYALGVLTADCAPVLFACADKPVIGAAHAGWGGALNGILGNTIDEMENLGAVRENIIAVIGPCIQQDSYEVQKDFYQKFIDVDKNYESFFKPKDKEHWLFDLPLFCLRQLQAAGLDKVETFGLDTYSDADRFFSYRRSCHAGENDYGRQVSAIVLAT